MPLSAGETENNVKMNRLYIFMLRFVPPTAAEWRKIMKNIKYLIISVFIFLLLTACGNNNTGTNTASPSPATNQTDNAGNNAMKDVGDAVKDVGNGAANGVKDVSEGVKDVGDGVADGIDKVTGNENK